MQLSTFLAKAIWKALRLWARRMEKKKKDSGDVLIIRKLK